MSTPSMPSAWVRASLVASSEGVFAQHLQGVEQLVDPGGLLDLAEAEVLVVDKRGLLALQPGEEVGDRLGVVPAGCVPAPC